MKVTYFCFERNEEKSKKNEVISNSRTRVCQKSMKKYNYSVIYGWCVYIYAIYTQCALGLKRVWYPLRKAVLHWVKATMVSVKEGSFSLV